MLSLLLLSSACADVVDESVTVEAVYGTDTNTPNYTVSVDGCNGIILNARWILTTAKCIGTPGSQNRAIRFATSATTSELLWDGPVSTFVHPDAGVGTLEEQAWHDVGLIHLFQRGIDMPAKGITSGAPLLADATGRAPGRGTQDPSVRVAGWGNTGCTNTGDRLRRSQYFELLTPYNGQGFAVWSEQNPTPGLCNVYDRGAPLLWTKTLPRELGSDLVAGWYSVKASTGLPLNQTRTYFSEAKDNVGWVASTIAAHTSYAYDTGTTTGSAVGGYGYRIETVTAPGAGTIQNSGKCFHRGSGLSVTVQPCNGSSAQQWTYTITGLLKTPAGDCLTKFTDIGTGAVTLGAAPCNAGSVANQTFYTTSTPSVALRQGSSAVIAGAVGSTPTLGLYTPGSPNQSWTIAN